MLLNVDMFTMLVPTSNFNFFNLSFLAYYLELIIYPVKLIMHPLLIELPLKLLVTLAILPLINFQLLVIRDLVRSRLKAIISQLLILHLEE